MSHSAAPSAAVVWAATGASSSAQASARAAPRPRISARTRSALPCPALAAPRALRPPGRLSLPPGPALGLGGANSGGPAQPCAPRDSAPLGLHLQAAAARALPAACSESAAVCAVRLQLWLLAWSRALSAGAGLRLAALAAPRRASWVELCWARLGCPQSCLRLVWPGARRPPCCGHLGGMSILCVGQSRFSHIYG